MINNFNTEVKITFLRESFKTRDYKIINGYIEQVRVFFFFSRNTHVWLLMRKLFPGVRCILDLRLGLTTKRGQVMDVYSGGTICAPNYLHPLIDNSVIKAGRRGHATGL